MEWGILMFFKFVLFFFLLLCCLFYCSLFFFGSFHDLYIGLLLFFSSFSSYMVSFKGGGDVFVNCMALTGQQKVDAEVVKKPFHFLIKIPRYVDYKFKEQIRLAQLQVEERTQNRDAIRATIQMKRGAAVGKQTIDGRDLELKRVLAADNKLHPALFSAEAEHKVFFLISFLVITDSLCFHMDKRISPDITTPVVVMFKLTGIHTKQKGMVLPFEPLSITFDDIRYSVDMPHVS
ncbi:hypothetical protein NE237_008227 [Protea cynaroides]|uniref:Uncharacterized protein n=1 Tax=Protea cynaroides TaxID=273540 RepID=A0A9Q0KQN8_9MAGN|nr:hypothetical protein NE237_008227 [Protea cynaroides]